MNLDIMQGILLGGLAGLLLTLALRKQPRPPKGESDPKPDPLERGATQAKKQSLMNRWSVRLALVGVVMGILTTFGQGYTQIGFMIGFAIPFALILGAIGLVIDLMSRKKK